MALLEGLNGLECRVIKKSEAFNPFYKARLDSEFFQKHLIAMHKKVSALNSQLLSDIAFVTDGEHGNAITFTTGYSKYFGARHVLTGILTDNDVEFITKEHHEKLSKTELQPRDILISCVGANIGHASIVPDDVGVANIVRNVALIRSTSSVLNEYLLAYFLSEFGRTLYNRMNSGNAQPLVSLDYIKTVPVFVPSNDFQIQIKNIIGKSLTSLEKAKTIYKQTSNTLLIELEFSNWQATEINTVVKKFSDSFAEIGRLDAEYYQLGYDEIEKKLKTYKNGTETIGQCLNLFDDNFNPEEEGVFKYIELADVGNSGEILNCTNDFGKELPSRARRLVSKGNVIVSAIEGSLEKCALISEDYDQAICSTGFYVVNSKKINSETLIVLFKSFPLQQLMKKNCSGTILTSMNKQEFLSIPIPIIDKNLQKEISKEIQKSFALRKQSTQLLEIAKQAVEIAIEENEEVAFNFIHTKKDSFFP